MYSTDSCALCDRALDMLLGMPSVQGMQLEVIDIAAADESDELLRLYAESIPVLCVGDATLHSPFNEVDVEGWLRGLEGVAK
jgi:hypothetical protein